MIQDWLQTGVLIDLVSKSTKDNSDSSLSEKEVLNTESKGDCNEPCSVRSGLQVPV